MGKLEDHWGGKAKERFVGRKIVESRYMTEEEAEGNNAGALFGQDSKGNNLDMPVL